MLTALPVIIATQVVIWGVAMIVASINDRKRAKTHRNQTARIKAARARAMIADPVEYRKRQTAPIGQ